MTNLAAIRETTALRQPARSAVRLDDVLVTYADLWDLSGRAAQRCTGGMRR
jgi:acyl-CoA synthetase (AMP-forming)/AMP-acid ligase II